VKQSNRKKIAIVFWVNKGDLFIVFLSTETTITVALYGETLKNLCRAIQNQRRGMLTKGFYLFQDYAWFHDACESEAILVSLVGT